MEKKTLKDRYNELLEKQEDESITEAEQDEMDSIESVVSFNLDNADKPYESFLEWKKNQSK